MEVDYKNIKVIGFDADDTLWVNETYFREAEEEVGALLSHFETPNKIDQELFKIEIKNLPTYGYGVKGFILSMIELALELSNNTVSNDIIGKILEIGKSMINKPIELLEGVEEVLIELSKDYKLIVVTKGDLLDQERKLEKSGLLKHFHHIEVLSEKHDTNYRQLLKRLDIEPKSFLMIGNSLKSDVLPLVKVGAQAIHMPFHTTWQHEKVTKKEANGSEYTTVEKLTEILDLFN
ncbi:MULTISPECIES: HAD family hydrolase [Winogradskyella]|uniref:HAD family hydrolase n=1 Tax=Winogradskyella TaxID=286104 RepID=UPI0015CAC01F|nr:MULTISPECIES: HAD family hydrolase [Winogradskyella]QXP79440.1 HAD family hydrolase [Winogradskyella sp. HaHa_3_26]